MTSDNQHSEHLEPSAPSGGDDLMEQQQLLAEQETTPGTPGAAVANGRGYMVKKGSPGQPACHVFPEELRKKVSHEFADKWSEEEQRQLARLVGSPSNLFVQTTEDNKLHRKYEEELNRSLAGGSDLSARAARRAVRMLDRARSVVAGLQSCFLEPMKRLQRPLQPEVRAATRLMEEL